MTTMIALQGYWVQPSVVLASVLALASVACRVMPPPVTPDVASDPVETARAPATGLTPAAEPANATASSEAAASAVPGGIVREFCIRPERDDVLFSLRRQRDESGETLADTEKIYRVAFDIGGISGPVTQFLDLGEHYGPDYVQVDSIVCHPDTHEVLVVVGNWLRMEGGGWWSELWLLDAAGHLVDDHAIARDIGPRQVAWSPDGDSLLVEGSTENCAGRVFWLDLKTNQTRQLDDVGLWMPTGAGGGWLRWSHDGRYAIVESILIVSDDARDAHSIQTVDLSATLPEVVGTRDLPDVLTSAIAPGGMVYLASAQPAIWPSYATTGRMAQKPGTNRSAGCSSTRSLARTTPSTRSTSMDRSCGLGGCRRLTSTPWSRR
jgi:hypothetical protein